MDFNPEYCELLRTQVEEEINYLQTKGHNAKNPLIPCIFCNDYNGHNFCTRVDELKRFLSEIMVKINSKPEPKSELMPLIGFSS